MDIFTYKPDWSESPSVNYEFSREENKFPGTFNSILPVYKTPRTFNYGYTNLTKKDEYEILSFFIDRKGKLKGFWLPIWKNTYTCLNDITAGATSFDISFIDTNSVYNKYEYVFFYLKTGGFYYYQIDTITKINSTTERINLFSPFVNSFSRDEIAFCGKMLYVRFDTDEIEFSFSTARTSSLNLSFIEMVNEYERQY